MSGSSQPAATNLNLAWPFFCAARSDGARLCVSADGHQHTYSDTLHAVSRIASWLSDDGTTTPRYVGILASRSYEACLGILATAWSGATYIPLNLTQPAEALAQLLDRLDLDALVADCSGLRKLTAELIPHLPKKVLVPGRDHAPNSDWRTFSNLGEECDFEPRPVAADHAAYIEFTSGSTGVPKGVVVPNGAVAHFLRIVRKRYSIQPGDRVAETCDITFDLSVFNMFAAWSGAGSLYVVPKTQAMAPAKFIQDLRITVCLLVPSMATAMSRMGMLRAGAFPHLRLSLFCGEPLPSSIAMAWKKAAPSSIVDNVYGPTEATVFCFYERIEETPNITKERDVIAIGHPLDGTDAAIWDSHGHPAATGSAGELMLAGRQLALGYLNDAEKTAARFVERDGQRWYRTGDLAYRDEQGLFHHLGRLDNQIKIRGHRIELEEIEAHLRQVYDTSSVAAVAWPTEFGSATGIVAFVSGPQKNGDEAITELRRRMPLHMVPGKVHVLEELPVNSSGKVDRKILAQQLQEGKY